MNHKLVKIKIEKCCTYIFDYLKHMLIYIFADTYIFAKNSGRKSSCVFDVDIIFVFCINHKFVICSTGSCIGCSAEIGEKLTLKVILLFILLINEYLY